MQLGGFRAISRLYIAFLTAFLLAASVNAQGSKQDYERAASYGERTRDKVFRLSVRPHWLDGRSQFWYRIDIGPKQHEFVFVDAEQGARRLAFDHHRVATALSKACGKEILAKQLPFRSISFNDDRSAVRFTAHGKHWQWNVENNELGIVREISERKSASHWFDKVAFPVGKPAASALPLTQCQTLVSRTMLTQTAKCKPANAEDTGVKVLDSVHRSRRTGEETSVRFVNRMAGKVELFWIDRSGDRQHYETIAAGEQHEQHTYEGHVWLVVDADGRPVAAFEATAERGLAVIDGSRRPTIARRKAPPSANRAASTSPDGCWRAFIRDHNVVVREAESEEEFALGTDGTADDPYEPRFHWSPDSKKLVVMRVRKGDERKIHFVESSPKDQLQPKLRTVNYAKPGDRMPVSRPRLFDMVSRSQVKVDGELFPNAWSISEMRWSPDSDRFTFLYNQRGHQVLRIVAVDADSGETRAVVDEQCRTFIDYAGKKFTHYLDETAEIIWMSERDGWNHLYLYDAATGKVKNQITRGPWVVRGVERVDRKARQIWFRAGGIRPEQDPYYVHLCRVNFDGRGLAILTKGDGNHKWDFSPDRRLFIDRWSRVDQPTVTELRCSEDGSLVCELERADWSALRDTGWRPPQRFVAKGRDGETDIYGIIVRPTNFDPTRKYPIIEKIYAGPHSAFVPKSFGLLNDLYAMAELGFLVVQIDGMGTSHRSKAFHDVCWKNLGDSGFPDRIAWIKAAAVEHPEMDVTRVGIYGGSAGGQSALRGLLMHGDFYKAGAADCGCHDNRMDKIWWNELWMGWPVGPHYAQQSNVTQAHRLQGKLLLTVGELDRNVDPASTMQVVDALIKANKDFEMLVVPGAGHGVGERPYAKRRRADFFVRHLLSVEPRWEP